MVQPDKIRREWKEALEQVLYHSLRGHKRTEQVWRTKVSRLERIAKANSIRLDPLPASHLEESV